MWLDVITENVKNHLGIINLLPTYTEMVHNAKCIFFQILIQAPSGNNKTFRLTRLKIVHFRMMVSRHES